MCVCVCVCVRVVPGAYFRFPTLHGSTFITNGNSDVDLPFTVVDTCDPVPANISRITITELKEAPVLRCFFVQTEMCSSNDHSSCRCPEDGTDLYHFLLPADPSNNGTWMWSAKPADIEDYYIDILVTGE